MSMHESIHKTMYCLSINEAVLRFSVFWKKLIILICTRVKYKIDFLKQLCNYQ